MTKSYKHIGTNPIHIPSEDGERVIVTGDSFSADLPIELEAFLTQIGAISVVVEKVKPLAPTWLEKDKE